MRPVARDMAWLSLLFLAVCLPRLGFPPVLNNDEAYYVPAARAYLSGRLDTNPNHPPLGKMLIALGMAAAGDHPAGWRTGSVAAGLAVVLLTYLFGRALFAHRPAALFAGALVGLDFLHLVMSRIAMLDIYQSAFVLAGLYCTYRYGQEERCSWWVAGGVLLGMGLACKLSALGGLAAAGVFYLVRFRRRGLGLAGLTAAVAGAVYAALHLPLILKGAPLSWMLYADNLRLHFQGEFRHPHLAPMAAWPWLSRPYWFWWVNDEAHRRISAIGGLGSPLFWWGFWLFFARQVGQALRGVLPAVMVVAGYACLYGFWLCSSKGGFFFYMLSCVPFMALTVAEAVARAWEGALGRVAAGIYLGGAAVLFVRFYPLLTGLVRPYTYFDQTVVVAGPELVRLAVGPSLGLAVAFLNLLLFFSLLQTRVGESAPSAGGEAARRASR